MSVLSALLYAVGVVHLLAGVPAIVVPSRVRGVLPERYATAVGGRREWRGFGAGVAGIGISLVIIANGLAA